MYWEVAREQKLVNTQGQPQVHRLDLQVPGTLKRIERVNFLINVLETMGQLQYVKKLFETKSSDFLWIESNSPANYRFWSRENSLVGLEQFFYIM